MTIHYTDDTVTLHHGGCLDVLRTMSADSVDAIVTDPPYGLSNTRPSQVSDTVTRWVAGDREYLPGGAGFMGKAWDAFVPPVAVWDECLRVLKPGGHCLVFAGTRTVDLMALGLRLAGFDIRDSIAWMYGSGFPKSHDVSKAIDKAAGALREKHLVPTRPQNVAPPRTGEHPTYGDAHGGFRDLSTPLTDDAHRWEGWGTALKPAHEPITVARKPFPSTVAANVLLHGTGALNINATRVGSTGGCAGAGEGDPANVGAAYGGKLNGTRAEAVAGLGRWPANVVLDENQAAALDAQSGESVSTRSEITSTPGGIYGAGAGLPSHTGVYGHDDFGGASRFFYTAKAGTSERIKLDGIAHPTVKPLSLLQWLVRLVTPPGGVVLDPFTGSGTTLEAALIERFRCIGIEREADYLPLIVQRINRRRDPLAFIETAGEDLGLFGDAS